MGIDIRIYNELQSVLQKYSQLGNIRMLELGSQCLYMPPAVSNYPDGYRGQDVV